MGAWIEINNPVLLKIKPLLSLLSWERGLKSQIVNNLLTFVNVAPLVGAWIEIDTDSVKGYDWDMVAPLVGAWIEIVDSEIRPYRSL